MDLPMSTNPSDARAAPLPGMEEEAALLSQVLEAELKHIRNNRHWETPENVVARSLVGLALSGGGIRSATTNLGVLQALSRMEILPMVDYLSTVSGGGYIGACLSSLLTDRRAAQPAQCDPCAQSIYTDKEAPQFTTAWDEFPFRAEYDDKRKRPVGGELVAHLRTHGNFLIARWGLLRRETMRSIGNLLTGTTYSVVLFLLTLLTFSALYLTLTWLIAPGLLDKLRREPTTQTAMVHPMVPSDSAVVRVRKDPCDPGTPGCEVETRTTLQTPTALQRIIHKASVAGAPLVAWSRTWSAGYWQDSLPAGFADVPPPLQPLLLGLAIGAAFSIVVLVGLRILTSHGSGSGQRKEELSPGESAEDVFERGVLKKLALAALLVTFLTFLWFRVSQSDTFLGIRVSPTGKLTGSEQFAWLLAPFAVLAGARLASLLLAMFLRSWTRRMRSLWGGFQAITIFGWWITLAFAALPLVIYGLRDYTGTVGIGAVSSLVLTRLLTSRAAATKRRFAMPTGLRHALLGFAVACVIALGVLFFAVVIVPTVDKGNVYWILILAAIPLLALAFLVNPNKLSPHYFYQDRLAETYLLSELADPVGGMQLYRDAMEMPLHCLHGPPAGVQSGPADPKPRNTAPYHLISAAINLAGSRDLTRKDRKSGYWLFSKLYCGSTHTGFRPTTTYSKGQLKVAQAIAISGAAASSAIGQDTFFAQAFAMVLFNIRLGYWLDNPMNRSGPPRPIWPQYLWDEVVMHTTENSKLVNLSDGGHTGDNVGIYPLLQRRCKVIIACDAERDPAITFSSFTEALRHAYIDMGIGVDIDLTLIRPDSTTGMSRSHCAVGRIRYPDRPDQESYLIYLKNSLNGDEPEPVLNYKSRFQAFPHETTADQFFDDAQFESYRALGVHLAEHTFGQWILSKRFAPLRAHHGPVS